MPPTDPPTSSAPGSSPERPPLPEASKNPPEPPTPAASSAHRHDSPRWHLAAAFAGWLLPGLGHFLLGQPRRAVILAITIGTLWLSGLLIGGLSIVDRGDHPAWFLGQMLIAPSLAADTYRDRLAQAHTRLHYDSARRYDVDIFNPAYDPPFQPAFARAHEQGILFTSLAGLLNLLAIIDVLYRDPRFARDAV